MVQSPMYLKSLQIQSFNKAELLMRNDQMLSKTPFVQVEQQLLNPSDISITNLQQQYTTIKAKYDSLLQSYRSKQRVLEIEHMVHNITISSYSNKLNISVKTNQTRYVNHPKHSLSMLKQSSSSIHKANLMAMFNKSVILKERNKITHLRKDVEYTKKLCFDWKRSCISQLNIIELAIYRLQKNQHLKINQVKQQKNWKFAKYQVLNQIQSKKCNKKLLRLKCGIVELRTDIQTTREMHKSLNHNYFEDINKIIMKYKQIIQKKEDKIESLKINQLSKYTSTIHHLRNDIQKTKQWLMNNSDNKVKNCNMEYHDLIVSTIENFISAKYQPLLQQYQTRNQMLKTSLTMMSKLNQSQGKNHTKSSVHASNLKCQKLKQHSSTINALRSDIRNTYNLCQKWNEEFHVDMNRILNIATYKHCKPRNKMTISTMNQTRTTYDVHAPQNNKKHTLIACIHEKKNEIQGIRRQLNELKHKFESYRNINTEEMHNFGLILGEIFENQKLKNMELRLNIKTFQKSHRSTHTDKILELNRKIKETKEMNKTINTAFRVFLKSHKIEMMYIQSLIASKISKYRRNMNQSKPIHQRSSPKIFNFKQIK